MVSGRIRAQFVNVVLRIGSAEVLKSNIKAAPKTKTEHKMFSYREEQA